MKRWSSFSCTTLLLLAAGWGLVQAPAGSDDRTGPHTDPVHGVQRLLTDPPSIGQCTQCHDSHASQQGTIGPNAYNLFAPGDNGLCFSSTGVGGCHRDQPLNYPLTEQDRLPDYADHPGYFEANTGGERIHGVQYRGRWPGQAVYENAGSYAGHDYSPHDRDPDMPRRDATGHGLCLNCHDPHATDNPLDLLVGTYLEIGGYADFGPPSNYALCFGCHGSAGPAGMNPAGRWLEDYYDGTLNGETAGHQIRKDPDIALSWPSNVHVGDKLPCYDCHNPHGSQGADGAQPNLFLLRDDLPGWYGLNDLFGDAQQGRRFCFGCHIPSDGVPGSRTVDGIVMNTIPDRGPHRSWSQRNCFDVHGRDYAGPSSFNVHHPRY